MTAVGAGDRTSCAVSTAGLRCWGSNSFGKLGQGDLDLYSSIPAEEMEPVVLGDGYDRVTDISVGSRHICVVVDHSGVKCWGGNDDGQLGLGDEEFRGDGCEGRPYPPADLDGGSGDAGWQCTPCERDPAPPEAGPDAGEPEWPCEVGDELPYVNLPVCDGADDFTPCKRNTYAEGVTELPDLSYDICINRYVNVDDVDGGVEAGADGGVIVVPDAGSFVIVGSCQSPGACVADVSGEFPCNVPGPDFKLADTGQELCYDVNGVVMDCFVGLDCVDDVATVDGGFPDAEVIPLCGQDGKYRKGLAVEGDRFDYHTVEDGCFSTTAVSDHQTGLIWMGLCRSNGPGCHACDQSIGPTTGTWYQAAAYCNGLDWGGNNDWRLPSPLEMVSIYNWDVHLLVDAGLEIADHTKFWTSDRLDIEEAAARVFSTEGQVFQQSFLRGVESAPLCVRGGDRKERSRFERLTDEIRVDRWTGREWDMQYSGQPVNWADALGNCEQSETDGKSDWRLPDINELLTLSGRGAGGPDLGGQNYLSSTTRMAGASSAVYCLQDYGFSFIGKGVEYSRGLCVRNAPEEP